MATSIITADDARQFLNYDPDQGYLTWKISFRANVVACNRAGCVHKKTGYWRVGLLGGRYQAHRLAWLITHGEWPDVIDHINGDKLDNRLTNLRSVNALINNQNRRTSIVGAKSPLLGAQWHKGSGLWKSVIRWECKQVHIGMFKTDIEAHNAYLQAKRVLHEGGTI